MCVYGRGCFVPILTYFLYFLFYFFLGGGGGVGGEWVGGGVIGALSAIIFESRANLKNNNKTLSCQTKRIWKIFS